MSAAELIGYGLGAVTAIVSGTMVLRHLKNKRANAGRDAWVEAAEKARAEREARKP